MYQILVFIAVCAGAAIGAMARYGLDLAFASQPPARQNRATLLANVTGSLLIGVIVGVLNQNDLLAQPPWWSQTLTAGIAGGLTTFSTFAAQVITQAQKSLLSALKLAAAHAVFGFAAALGGWWVTLQLLD